MTDNITYYPQRTFIIWVGPYYQSLYMYFGGTLSVSGFLIHLQLFGVSVLGGPSPMLEGIGFRWALIGSQITFSKNDVQPKTNYC